MKIKLNQDFRGFKAGKTITIKDDDGRPTDPFWRARLMDAPMDNCITVIKPKMKTAVKTKTSDENEPDAKE